MAGCAAGGWLIALLAATPTPAPAPVAAPTPAPAPAPSMELLLHLAEFGDAEDRYIDPAELEDLAAEAEPDRPEKTPREIPAEGAEDEAP